MSDLSNDLRLMCAAFAMDPRVKATITSAADKIERLRTPQAAAETLLASDQTSLNSVASNNVRAWLADEWMKWDDDTPLNVRLLRCFRSALEAIVERS